MARVARWASSRADLVEPVVATRSWTARPTIERTAMHRSSSSALLLPRHGARVGRQAGEESGSGERTGESPTRDRAHLAHPGVTAQAGHLAGRLRDRQDSMITPSAVRPLGSRRV
jgi:hypothetical protein